MTFGAKESSRYQGNKAEIYLFVYGPNSVDYYAYTTAEQPITRNETINGSTVSVTYAPYTIDHESVKVTGSMDKSRMPITVPPDCPVGDLYRIAPPSYVVNLIIREGHVDDVDAEFKIVWAGRILGASWGETTLSLTAELTTSSMRRTGLRRRWQYGCGHALYSADCGANKAAATATATVSTVSGAKVVLTSGWATPERKAKYLNGMIIYTVSGRPVVRRIVAVNGTLNELSCNGPLVGLAPAATVSVILGCNHQMDDCKDLHSNINNFGGDPWIPTKSPFGIINNFY